MHSKDTNKSKAERVAKFSTSILKGEILVMCTKVNNIYTEEKKVVTIKV